MRVVEASDVKQSQVCFDHIHLCYATSAQSTHTCVDDSTDRAVLRTRPCTKDSVKVVSPQLGLCSSMGITSTQEGSLTNQDRSQT